jgi:hypothetical protein
MCNGPAKIAQVDKLLQHSGDLIGDPFEISTIRKEDYETHKGKSEYEDLHQAMSKPSADSSRGHQGPAAFLIMASGLEEHGCNSKSPLPYSHIDIAGSCGNCFCVISVQLTKNCNFSFNKKESFLVYQALLLCQPLFKNSFYQGYKTTKFK